MIDVNASEVPHKIANIVVSLTGQQVSAANS